MAPVLLGLAAGVLSLATAAGSGHHEPVDSGGGGKVFDQEDHFTKDQRKKMQEQVDRNMTLLQAQGKLPAPTLSAPVLLSWPLRQTNGLQVFDLHFISAYVDLDPVTSDHLLDHNCGTRTYDTSSFNHLGTDYNLWPFPWLWMDNSQVEIVAAAPGVIVNKVDGNPDRSCTNPDLPWNAVYIRNDDGNIVFYGHMKTFSTTSKALGERVERGEYLGLVGSSGNSSGPHLHLEIHDPSYAVIDPYSGPCNPIPSLWENQRPYYDSRINMLLTGSSPPIMGPCAFEIPHERIDFDPGDTIYFTTFWHDRLADQVTVYTIYQPDGSIWTSWSYSTDYQPPFATWSYWAFTFAGAPTGIWKFEAIYEGRVHEHYFSIGGPFPVGSVPPGGTPGTPLSVEKLPGGDLRLSWGVSCMSSETDWAVYEGSLGKFYSHVPRQCSTGGQTIAVVTPAVADSYYLVVARNAGWEGSYGTNSSGMEIPPPDNACLLQNIGVCDPCGDNMITPPELCDGTSLGGESCLSQGFDAGSLTCSATCDAFVTSGCTTVCGDMVRRGNEICDGSDLGGESCQTQGIGGGTLSCNGTCSGFDTSGCIATCGNGIRSGAELCDGPDLGGQSCMSQGFPGGALACNGSCDGFITSGCTSCGDNHVDPGEMCDGTDLAGQDCISLGWEAGTLACNSTCSGFITANCRF